MEGSSSQSGSSSNAITSEILNNNGENRTNLSENQVLLKLEEDGFTAPDDKVEELLKSLTKPKFLYALKILFENLQNEFSSRAITNSLKALADPTPFDHYSQESVAVLELHLRTWVAVLERICFSLICLTRELREDIYNSLAKFADIHRRTTQVIERGLENNFKSNLNISQQQKNDDENYIKKRNYNIDFLLIHLRDTLHSLRDDETWFEEILRRVKDILKAALGVTSTTGISINDNSSILTMLSQLRQGLSFKHPVASYYVDWRIMLIIQHNINKWSLNSEKIISKKFGEMILMEYFWSYVEREWISLSDKAMLDSQTKFDELSNKVIKALKNTESFLNDLAGNEPLALPHTLWFGILDLAHNLIQKSTKTATYGLCYYLAIESLNKAPSSFIQFKSIEILLHLHSINNELFSMIDLDFDQYIKKLNENNSLNNSTKFQNLLSFVKEKYHKDLEILNDSLGKGRRKGKEKSSVQKISFKREQIDNTNNILDCIANEITCPITYEPANQLCILDCQHVISLSNLRKLKHAKCPICQQVFLDNNIRYLSQNSIYKNLYSQFFEAGHILSSVETEDSKNDQYNNSNSDSDESEDDMILTKKKQLIKLIKSKSNISLQSIFQQVKQIGNKKQHPIFHNVLKELREKNYEKAVLGCKEFLTIFPKSYSMRCILACTYRCQNKYDDAVFYLKEAIYLKEKKPIAWYIYGEILFRQNDYEGAINKLNTSSKGYKAKTNNLHIILGSSYLYQSVYHDDDIYNFDKNYALNNFNIVLQNDPKNYLCLKYCAYIYEIQSEYSNALNSLDKLLSINKEDSLILCFYGEILSSLERYDEAISYFTKANDIDPENTHILSKRAITYSYLKKYEEALLDIKKAIQLDPLNDLLFHIRCKIYVKFEKFYEALLDFNKSIAFLHYEGKNFLEESSNFWSYLYNHYNISKKDFSDFGILDNLNKYMYKAKMVYYMSNLDETNYNIYSLTGKVISEIYKKIMLPKLQNVWENYNYHIVWKLSIDDYNPSSNSYIKFTIKTWMEDSNITYQQQEHKLESSELFKLPKYKWFEYTLPFTINTFGLQWIQPSIEINNIHVFIDYVRFTPNKQDIKDLTCLKNKPMSRLLNVPEAFEERYLLKKEVENLLDLKDIFNYITV